jgi:hypothetical protein
MQQADGSIRWKLSQDLNPIWMTAYAAPALAGHPLPVPAVPRATETERRNGEAGAGGGGRGAPLFSRPKPQSGGRATGGVRRVEADDEARHTKKRRGAPAAAEPPPPSSAQSSGDGADDGTVWGAGSGTGFEATEGDTGDSEPQSGPGSSSEPEERSPQAEPGSRLGAEDGEYVAGVIVDPQDLSRSGLDGEGDRDAAAPGLAGRLEEPADGAALALAALIALAIALGAALESRQRADRDWQQIVP